MKLGVTRVAVLLLVAFDGFSYSSAGESVASSIHASTMHFVTPVHKNTSPPKPWELTELDRRFAKQEMFERWIAWRLGAKR